jgi:hypothetical protein
LSGISLWLLTALVSFFLFPHYAAPAYPLLLLPTVHGARRLCILLGRRVPAARRRLALCVAGAFFIVLLAGERLSWTDPFVRIAQRSSTARQKAQVEERLLALDGRHVVFAVMGPQASIHAEWVSNGADIDAARIVWARSMSPEKDQALRVYYDDRHAWRFEIGVDGPRAIRLIALP